MERILHKICQKRGSLDQGAMAPSDLLRRISVPPLSSEGPGFMANITSGLNQDKYIMTLGNFLSGTIRFEAWIRQQPFKLLTWPPQSPDLNPFENMWGIVKRRIRQTYHDPPKNKDQLDQHIEAIWSNLTKDDCLRLYDSMPWRIQAVLKSHGSWTRF